jgi:hypothetical protein
MPVIMHVAYDWYFLHTQGDVYRGVGSLSPLIYAVLVHRMRKVMVVARIFSPFMNHNRNY